jgi:hypothetical protein
MPMAGFKALCMDARDAALIGRFWAAVFDGDLVVRDDGVARVDLDPGIPRATSSALSRPEAHLGLCRVRWMR